MAARDSARALDVCRAARDAVLVNEKGILVAPTLGRQETEYLGPMIDREILMPPENATGWT